MGADDMTDDPKVIDFKKFRRRAKASDVATFDDEEDVKCIIRLLAPDRVQVWLSDSVETSDQFNWIYSGISRALKEIVDLQLTSTSSEASPE